MALTVDARHLGVSEVRWKNARRLQALAPLGPLVARRIVVVAPHPDDEILGAGGLIQFALAQRLPIEVVAVTDGEASHPRSRVAANLDWPRVRRDETHAALLRLGWREPKITRLHLPDGSVDRHRDEL